MKPIDGYFLINPEDLHWRPSNMMKIPNADFLERTKSEILGARLWRLPPNSANTLHKHIRAEEFYFVLEGVGRMRAAELMEFDEQGKVQRVRAHYCDEAQSSTEISSPDIHIRS